MTFSRCLTPPCRASGASGSERRTRSWRLGGKEFIHSYINRGARDAKTSSGKRTFGLCSTRRTSAANNSQTTGRTDAPAWVVLPAMVARRARPSVMRSFVSSSMGVAGRSEARVDRAAVLLGLESGVGGLREISRAAAHAAAKRGCQRYLGGGCPCQFPILMRTPTNLIGHSRHGTPREPFHPLFPRPWLWPDRVGKNWALESY